MFIYLDKQGPADVTPSRSVDREIMGVIIYSFNLNVSPKMSYGVLECDIFVRELHVYDFVIKDCEIKRALFVLPPCILETLHIECKDILTLLS